jgi:predicted metalloprotease
MSSTIRGSRPTVVRTLGLLVAAIGLPAASHAQDVSHAILGEPLSYPEMNYDEYRSDIDVTIQTLNQFWAATFPEVFGKEYSPPTRVYAYDPGAGDEGLPCGPDGPPGSKNARYCLLIDTIQWDEPGLILPFYNEIGDFAALFMIAHEWGHSVQGRLGILTGPYVTKAKELQADCFAGAWAAYMEQEPLLPDSTRVFLEQGDIDEATLGLFAARDSIGTPWLDPQAHGSGNQRIRAFNDGLDGGARRCIEGDRPREVRER